MTGEMLRLFIALKPPEGLVGPLGREQQALRQSPEPVKWVAPEALHLTLQFLGAVAAQRSAALGEALRGVAADSAPFTLELRGLGAFPNLRRPRVIWAGLAGELEALGQLQRRVLAATSQLGLQAEERPFKPHLTLGRVREGADRAATERLGQALGQRSFEGGAPWPVRELLLVKSDLRPSGPIYTNLGVYELKVES